MLPFGKDIYDLDVSPDGKYLTGSMFDVTGAAFLVRMRTEDLLKGIAGYDVLYEFAKTAPYNFTWTEDGRYIIGSAYQTGVSNIFRFDTETEAMDCLTNTETGVFRPVPIGMDSLIVFEYTVDGLRPVMIDHSAIYDVNAVSYLGNEVSVNHPSVKKWKLGSPLEVDLDEATTYHGDYNKLSNTMLSSAYPIVEAYKDRAAFGVRLNFMDPVGVHGGNLSVSATPDDNLPDEELIHASFAYSTYPWSIDATYNQADFYDFFGPTKNSRKGYSVSLSYENFLIADKPRFMDYKVSVSQYGDLETSPDYQNVAASFTEFTTASVSTKYKTFTQVYWIRRLREGAYLGSRCVWQTTSTMNFMRGFEETGTLVC